MKGSIDSDAMTVRSARGDVRLCGWTLARAHARSGGADTIAGYLGRNDDFDRAIAHVAVADADQNEPDAPAFLLAIDDGRVTAHQ